MLIYKKTFLKEIKSILKNHETNTTDSVSTIKYAIFFVSKILFACKLHGVEILCKNFDDFLYNYVLNIKEMGIFIEYSSFNLNVLSLEQSLYDLIYTQRDEISLDKFSPANLYENLLTPENKKNLGQVYTPLEVVKGMLDLTFSIKTIDENTKFLDPSCGGGYFLIEIFKKLKSINSIYYNINEENTNCDKSENILLKEKYIIENMIYGVDVEEFSVFLTKIELLFCTSITDINFNIYQSDFLTENLMSQHTDFDIIIGNPPYIGSKHMDKSYKTKIKEMYSDVFYDKSDISYCFFKKSYGLLKSDGIISFITSRYFMEAMFADKLRHYLINNFNIISVTDYNGLRVFKGAMVSPAVITLTKKKLCTDQNELNTNSFSYIKYTVENSYENIIYPQEKLKNSGWIILSSKEEELFDRIEKGSNTYIKDVCSIKQGIITGLDKAFILTEEQASIHNIENFLLKKWIKNSNITKNKIKYNNKYLIYTNLIQNERECPNAISYLLPYKEHLMNRRECVMGLRKWYELQWGRTIQDYENPKIVFPYKSHSNNFCYDDNDYFCSADVYIINELNGGVCYDYLQNYLNSDLFEFYFKCQAKKVGVNMYEYYPNKINTMKIFLPPIETQQKISLLGNFGIECFLKKVFNINEEENKIINKFIFEKVMTQIEKT